MSPRDDERPDDLFEDEGLERWLSRAERDPETSARLDFLADVAAAVEFEREALARDLPLGSKPGRRAASWRPWLLVAVAAGLLALLWLAWPAHDEGPASRLVAERAAPRYVPSDLRASGSDDPFARAMEPYGRGDWSGAARDLEALFAADPENGPAHFYLAAAREQLGELEPAEAHYRQAAASPDTLLSEHARLRLALLWWARGEKERARQELTRLDEAGGELSGNARAALRELTEGPSR